MYGLLYECKFLTIEEKKKKNVMILQIISYLVIIPPLPEGGGGILFYLCPSFRPSKIIFVAFFSVTVDDRNMIFGHKRHIGIPYCG